jgi:hypothetical protein
MVRQAPNDPHTDDERTTYVDHNGNQTPAAAVTSSLKNLKVILTEDMDSDARYKKVPEEQATHNLVKYSPVLENFDRYRFGVLVMDECHLVRNSNSSHNHGMRLIPTDGFVFCSATPIYSSLRDLLSYAHLTWKTLGFSNDLDLDVGDVEGLFHPNYDPLHDDNELELEGETIHTKGLIPLLHEKPHLQDQLAEAFSKGIRLWEFNPFFISAAGTKMKWTPFCGKYMIRRVQEQFMIRWGPSSRIQLPNNESTFVAVKIPPTVIRTVELYYGPAHHSSVKFETRRILDKLYTTVDAGDRESVNEVPSSTPSGTQLAGEQGGTERRGQLNFALHRLGIFAAFNHHFPDLFQKKNLRALITTEKEAELVIRQVRTGRPMDDAQLKRNRVKTAEEDEFGVRRAFELAKNDIFGALFDWYCQTANTTLSGNLVMPYTRQEILLYYIRDSPAAAHALMTCHKYIRGEGKRLVLAIDCPMLQQ